MSRPAALMLGSLGVITVGGAAESNPPFVPLADVKVFAGPNGEPFVPPGGDGSVARKHAPMDTATFWAMRSDLGRAAKRATTLTAFTGVPLARLREVGGKFNPAEAAGLFRSDGEWFHGRPYVLPDKVAQSVHALVFVATRPFSQGSRVENSFHADVCLKWEGSPLSETEVLVSYDSFEIKIYGAAGALWGQLSEEDIGRLRALLGPQLEMFDFQPIKEVPFTPAPRF